jgi:tRNA (guanosine-2'-O-)-methyltransferase
VRRDLPEVFEPRPASPLPAPPAEVVRLLGPLVTEARIARMREVLARRTRSLVPVLEDLADPHNGAAILRSADAFGCQEVHVIEDRHRFAVSHRVSRGTHRWLDLTHHPSTEACVAHLAERGYRVFVASMEGAYTPEDLAKVPRAAVVFGNEHRGASEALRHAAHGTYRIPMHGFVESLNVSVASAITLHVASQGRHGDLDEADRERVLARWLVESVRDAERVLQERRGA